MSGLLKPSRRPPLDPTPRPNRSRSAPPAAHRTNWVPPTGSIRQARLLIRYGDYVLTTSTHGRAPAFMGYLALVEILDVSETESQNLVQHIYRMAKASLLQVLCEKLGDVTEYAGSK